MDTAYKLLRINKQAGPEDIRQAYVYLARRYSPEQFPEKLAAIHQAYGQLALEPEAMAVFLRKAAAAASPLELAGLLWGDRAELKASPEPDFRPGPGHHQFLPGPAYRRATPGDPRGGDRPGPLGGQLGRGKILVGGPAWNRAAAFPEDTVKSVKRLMSLDQVLTLGGKGYRPEEISALILGYLWDEARRLEGLAVERLSNEPTAAALFYDQVRPSGETGAAPWKHTLVYDLGGGTFDVSILRMDEIVEVLASTGDTRLGGDDFDARLVALALSQIQEDGGPALARLTAAAEAFGRASMPAVDSDLSVAFGAAVEGGVISGENAELVLVDVAAHTLSLATISPVTDELECATIIPRRRCAPASSALSTLNLEPELPQPYQGLRAALGKSPEARPAKRGRPSGGPLSKLNSQFRSLGKARIISPYNSFLKTAEELERLTR